jgi:hypothetical protein
MNEVGYPLDTEYGPYSSYVSARLVNREFRETLDAIRVDGLSLLPWLRKKMWEEAVEFYTTTGLWEIVIIRGSKMWEACAEHSKTIKRKRRSQRSD